MLTSILDFLMDRQLATIHMYEFIRMVLKYVLTGVCFAFIAWYLFVDSNTMAFVSIVVLEVLSAYIDAYLTHVISYYNSLYLYCSDDENFWYYSCDTSCGYATVKIPLVEVTKVKKHMDSYVVYGSFVEIQECGRSRYVASVEVADVATGARKLYKILKSKVC